MDFGLILLVLGGFLLGGAYSIWKLDPATEDGRSGRQVAFAVVLLIAALMSSAAGILRLI